jgi:hypothetical protein
MTALFLLAAALVEFSKGGVEFKAESETTAIDPAHSVFLRLELKTPKGVEFAMPDLRERTVGFSLLVRPFRMAALRALCNDGDGEGVLRPSADFRTVTVGSEAVTLSDREALLFRLLYEARGEAVPRRVLAETVFPHAEVPEDSVNVYIHYLRKKLERNKKRIIRGHRGGGYSLLTD